MASSNTSTKQSVQSPNVTKIQSNNGREASLNILLLGETGVGKTTFINSFVNYLTYNTFDEAEMGDMVVVIPASFSITDQDTYESKVVQIGKTDANESNVENGESKTRGCKSYTFLLGNRKLRLIDAPGVGDTRGIDQDAKNFEHILSYISQYKHLDGICILLKPNEQRMNILFRFCIKELLTHLHANAKHNIMFVFTFGRANFFQPGNTAPLLKTLLKDLQEKSGVDVPFTKDNAFVFDNESFLSLAKCKNGEKFSLEQKNEFTKSWDRAVIEYGNLVERIVRCTPHIVRDTLSLNEAQQLIKKLHRPLAEVIRLIQENILLAEKHKVERLKGATTSSPSPSTTVTSSLSPPTTTTTSSPSSPTTTTSTKNSSDDDISIPQYSGEVVKLPYPRTVCTSKSCTRVVLVEGVQKVDYNTHCHEHCYLQGVEQEVINNPILRFCAAMGDTRETCCICNCSWSTHQHITYEYRIYLSYTNISLHIDNITKTPNASSSISSAEFAINQFIDNLKEELDKIISVCIKLSRFIRRNSITVYNNDAIEYIKHFIFEEETKQKSGAQNDEVIRGLQNTLKIYQEDMDFFKMVECGDGNHPTSTTANNIQGIPKTEEVFPLVESLYALPINGDKIRQQVEGLKNRQTENVAHREQEIRLPASAASSIVVGRLTNTLN